MWRLFFFVLCLFLVSHTAAAELQCGANSQEVDCYKKCISTCPTSNDESCSDDECAEGCQCNFNYRRTTDCDTCIPTRECPAFDCPGENEEYNPCPPYCPSDSCDQATADGHCPLPGRIGVVLECQPTCRCKESYWRKNGVCVPYAECNSDSK